MIIGVRVTPRAGRDAIEGPGTDGLLRVRVTAPPVDGAANRAVVKLIAAALSVPRSSVTVASGETSRTKRIRLDGVDATTVQRTWPGLERGDGGGG